MDERGWRTLRNAGLVLAVGASWGAYLAWWLAEFPSVPSIRDPYHPDWGTFIAMGLFLLVAGSGAGLARFANRRRLQAGGTRGPPWLTLRNAAGFAALFAVLLTYLQWEATGGPWAPSQCDHDGTPITQCPDYGYHGDQVRSLWITGGFALLATSATGTSAWAHVKQVRRDRAEPAVPALRGEHGDPMSWRLLVAGVGALVLSFALFYVAIRDRGPLGYGGATAAVAASGGALAVLVRPQSGILARWCSALVVAGAVVAFTMNYFAIVISQME